MQRRLFRCTAQERRAITRALTATLEGQPAVLFIRGSSCFGVMRMARFRNMLVHVYWEIDYNRVYDILSDLDDLRAFRRAIGALL
jgi:hypothetical protein